VLLIDASVYIFRAWYSLPDQFTDAEGRPTNAVYGFARFLCDLIERTGAASAAVAFDESLTESFRTDIFPDYKANREPAPAALQRQFAWCRELAHHAGLPVYSDPRFEADDLIATLAAHCRALRRPFWVVSGDKDLAQLIGADDRWWDLARDRRFDALAVREHFGVGPELIADFLALTGDPVDNIPGVPGVGPKTAAAVLNHFGGLDAVFERLDEIALLSFRGARTLALKLRQHRQTIDLARRLTALQANVADLTEPRIDRGPVDSSALDGLFDRLGFGRPMRERLRRVFHIPA